MTQDRRAGARRLARPAASLGGPRRGEGLDLVELFAALRMNQCALLGLFYVDGGGAGGQHAKEQFRRHDEAG